MFKIIIVIVIVVFIVILGTILYRRSFYTWAPAMIKNPFNTNYNVYLLNTPRPVVPINKGYDKVFGAADPFIVDNYIFAEIMKKGKGVIGVAKYNEDELIFTPALEENFHLSYPQVFQHYGKWYMIPEAYQSGSILLYQAKNFPYKWEKVKSIHALDGIDSTVFNISNKWYIFTTSQKTGKNLILTTNNFPYGHWSVVKNNPLPKGYRGGGQAIYHNKEIFVPLQPPSTIIHGYGYKLEVYKVNRDLSLEYVNTIMPPKGAGGLHHISCIPGADQCIVDLRRYKKI